MDSDLSILVTWLDEIPWSGVVRIEMRAFDKHSDEEVGELARFPLETLRPELEEALMTSRVFDALRNLIGRLQ